MARYRILPERSRLWAEATSSLHAIHVETDGLEGYIETEIADGRLVLSSAPKGVIELDASRINSGNPLLDFELERRLEVGKFPRIHGEALEVTAVGSEPRYHIRGELTFHGVTRAIDGDVKVRVVDERTIEVKGEHIIDVRQFNLTPPRLLLLSVQPEVRVRARVVAKREN